MRTRLRDGALDKYVHQQPVDPDPDGVQRYFAVPDHNLVSSSLQVYLDGEPVTLVASDPAAGTFEIAAPDEGGKLTASYRFQWFSDDELAEFLTQGAQLLQYTGADDAALPSSVRTPLLSYAAYYAYMAKAAEAAEALIGSEGGFSADNSKEHPNWLAMAKLAWETAEKELETIAENPITGTGRPAMRFVAYRLSHYKPRT